MNRRIVEHTSVIKYGARRLAKRKEALKQIKTLQMAGECNIVNMVYTEATRFFNLLKK